MIFSFRRGRRFKTYAPVDEGGSLAAADATVGVTNAVANTMGARAPSRFESDELAGRTVVVRRLSDTVVPRGDGLLSCGGLQRKRERRVRASWLLPTNKNERASSTWARTSTPTTDNRIADEELQERSPNTVAKQIVHEPTRGLGSVPMDPPAVRAKYRTSVAFCWCATRALSRLY
jgi:hypothetical protein